MACLAEVLNRKAQDSWADKERREQEELAQQLREVGPTAKRLILLLPEFLASVAKKHNYSAYIMERHYYGPYLVGRPKIPDRLAKQNLSASTCQRYLYGVDRILACWAIRQGMTVTIGQSKYIRDEAIFKDPLRKNWWDPHPDSEGIIFSW